MNPWTRYVDLMNLKQLAHGRRGSYMALRVEHRAEKSECDRIYENLQFFAMAYPNVQLQQSYLEDPAPLANQCVIIGFLDKKDN